MWFSSGHLKACIQTSDKRHDLIQALMARLHLRPTHSRNPDPVEPLLLGLQRLCVDYQSKEDEHQTVAECKNATLHHHRWLQGGSHAPFYVPLVHRHQQPLPGPGHTKDADLKGGKTFAHLSTRERENYTNYLWRPRWRCTKPASSAHYSMRARCGLPTPSKSGDWMPACHVRCTCRILATRGRKSYRSAYQVHSPQATWAPLVRSCPLCRGSPNLLRYALRKSRIWQETLTASSYATEMLVKGTWRVSRPTLNSIRRWFCLCR